MKSRNLWKCSTDILHLQKYSTKALASESDAKGNDCSFVLLFIPHQCAQTVEVVGAAFLIRLLLSAKIVEANTVRFASFAFRSNGSQKLRQTPLSLKHRPCKLRRWKA